MKYGLSERKKMKKKIEHSGKNENCIDKHDFDSHSINLKFSEQ